MSSKAVADKLDKLAKMLLEEALAVQPPPGGPNRLDVFKAVAQYHIGSTRAEKGPKDDNEAGASFQDLRRSLESLGTEKGN